MIDTHTIKPHMPVVCSNGASLATVDHLEGEDHIKLKKDASGQHHYIPTSWIAFIDDKVHLDRPDDRARREWSTAPIQGHDLAQEAEALTDPTHSERVRWGQQDPKADPTDDPARAERLRRH